ncbi:hypothetical protein ACHAWF_002563 [Thalassiosira exigua]
MHGMRRDGRCRQTRIGWRVRDRHCRRLGAWREIAPSRADCGKGREREARGLARVGVCRGVELSVAGRLNTARHASTTRAAFAASAAIAPQPATTALGSFYCPGRRFRWPRSSPAALAATAPGSSLATLAMLAASTVPRQGPARPAEAKSGQVEGDRFDGLCWNRGGITMNDAPSSL